MDLEVILKDGSRIAYSDIARAYYSFDTLVIVNIYGRVIQLKEDSIKIVGVFN